MNSSMTVFGLNKLGTIINKDSIEYIELAWNRRAYACGDFTLYISANEFEKYQNDLFFVMPVGTDEIGIVQSIQLEEKAEGDTVIIAGFFYEKILSYDCTEEKLAVGTSLLETVKALQNRLNGTILTVTGTAPTVKAQVEQFVNLEQVIYTNCIDENCIVRVKPDFENSAINVFFNKGRDLSGSVFFGKMIGNLESVRYRYDESNLRNTVRIKDTDETSSAIRDYRSNHVAGSEISLNVPNEYPRFADFKPRVIRGVSGKNPTTEAFDENIFSEEAKKVFGENNAIETVEASVIQEKYFYKVDYDLGDKVTVMIDRLRKEFVTEIIEVRELWKEGRKDIEIVFGEYTKRR